MDCGGGCDYILVVAEIRVKLMNGRISLRKEKIIGSLLKRKDTRTSFGIEVRNRYNVLQDEVEEHDIEGKCNNLQQSLLEVVEELVPCE